MNANFSSKNRVDILLQRQLEAVDTGNGAYAETFLRVLKSAGLTTRIIFSPKFSFGNRPWCSIHPRIGQYIDDVEFPRSVKLGSKFWSLSLIVWWRFFIRLIKAALIKVGIDMRVQSYLGRRMSSGEERIVAGVWNKDPSPITIAEYSSIAPVLALLNHPTEKGVLMHDLLSDRIKAYGSDNNRLYIPTREEEADWCKSADIMVWASANEAEIFAPFVPQATNIWLKPEPPVYDEALLEDTSDERRVVFIGTVHPGNIDALNYFLEDIWPVILTKKHDAEFQIVGSIGAVISKDLLRQEGIRVLGRVEHLESIGGPNSLGVAPTRQATGVSIKVMEYLMLEMPCLATPTSLEGFAGALDQYVTIAETPDQIATHVVNFLNGDALKSADNRAQKYEIQKNLSNQDVADLFAGLVADKA